jgi:hypothetical protein
MNQLTMRVWTSITLGLAVICAALAVTTVKDPLMWGFTLYFSGLFIYSLDTERSV